MVPYYHVGNEFQSTKINEEKMDNDIMEEDGNGKEDVDVVALTINNKRNNVQHLEYRQILRNLMIHEDNVLENLNDQIVQQCLARNDRSGAINVFLNRQFNSLNRKIPYIVGSNAMLKKGQNIVIDLSKILNQQQTKKEEQNKKQFEENKEPPAKKVRFEQVENDGVSGNSIFMEIDQEEEEFERMLREASESQ